MKLLHDIKYPSDLKKLRLRQLEELAREIREFLIRTVSHNGGHLAPNLGVVELTLALHRVLDCPHDKIIWDVGHQSYVHKLLTGRKEHFSSLRKMGGLSGFPRPDESTYDAFGTGHNSTSISAALGLARARDLKGENNQVAAVIGDGALTGGMAYEALNHAGHLKTNFMVVLNDNDMSIDRNVGGMSAYLGRIRTDPKYYRFKEELDGMMRRIPAIGNSVADSAERFRGALKYFLVPGILFEELGLTYLGPVDGHDVNSLVTVFDQARRIKGPVLVHTLTQKGKGYVYAEEEPSLFHGIGPFDRDNGVPRSKKKAPSYTEVFGKTLAKLAEEDDRVVGITAAMSGGTGLDKFADKHPKRFLDVGIAEQHAVTMSAGLASEGYRPVVALYSTFLQRAYDQVVHDVCLQKKPVVLAVDRAGIVGEDGETHQGLMDVSLLRHIPHMTLMAPRDEDELQHMLKTALDYEQGPTAIRYPRGAGEGVELKEPQLLPWGKAEVLREGEELLLVAAGSMVAPSLKAAEKLFWQGIQVAVINARFIKPLDEETILGRASRCGKVITVEENMLSGGMGSALLEFMENRGIKVPVRRLGIDDEFVEHGPRGELLARYGLDEEGIYRAALSFCREKSSGRLC